MPGRDRVFSARTFIQVGGIIAFAGALALGANGIREKPIQLGRQYFPAAAIAEKAGENAYEPKTAAPGRAAATPPAGPGTPNADLVKSPANSTPVDPPTPPPAGTSPAPPVPVPVPVPPPAEEPLPPDGIRRIQLADCRDLIDSPIAVFVDARNREFYTQGHIKGAVHLHHYDSADHIEEVRPILEAAFMVIVYCNGGDCEDSINLALDLVTSYGIPNENVHVFEGGYDEWKAAALPIVTGENRE